MVVVDPMISIYVQQEPNPQWLVPIMDDGSGRKENALSEHDEIVCPFCDCVLGTAGQEIKRDHVFPCGAVVAGFYNTLRQEEIT